MGQCVAVMEVNQGYENDGNDASDGNVENTKSNSFWFSPTRGKIPNESRNVMFKRKATRFPQVINVSVSNDIFFV